MLGEGLWSDLRGWADAHNQWQDLQAQLSRTDHELDRSLHELPDGFWFDWLKTKQKIKPLWDRDPSADWVLATQRLGDRIDALLAEPPVNIHDLKFSHNRFLFHARIQFFTIHRALTGICKEVLIVGQQLAEGFWIKAE